MKDWFDGLEPRERLTLLTGAALLGLALIWVLLIGPLYNSAGDQGQNIRSLQQDISRAQQLRSEILSKQKNGPGPQSPRDPLMITLERTAQTAGLQVKTSRPIDTSTIRVSFESAPFDSLVRWIGALERQHGIRIDIVSLDRLDTAGLVDAQLTLKRPG